MTLSEARKSADAFIHNFTVIANDPSSQYWENEKAMNVAGNLANILTVLLKALEDSIQKEKVREKIEDLEENNNGDDYSLTNVKMILQELLGE